jgi:hypothetical protein
MIPTVNILDTAALFGKTDDPSCVVTVSSSQRMGNLSAVKVSDVHGPGSKTIHWSAPDCGALFDMDLEYSPKASLVDTGFNELIFENPLDEASVYEDTRFSHKQFECFDQDIDNATKMEGNVHHQNQRGSMERHHSFKDKSNFSGLRDSLQSWQILEQQHTKSRSISVPKNRRKSTAF